MDPTMVGGVRLAVEPPQSVLHALRAPWEGALSGTSLERGLGRPFARPCREPSSRRSSRRAVVHVRSSGVDADPVEGLEDDGAAPVTAEVAESSRAPRSAGDRGARRGTRGAQGVRVIWSPLVRPKPEPHRPLVSRYQIWKVRVSPLDQPKLAARPGPQVAMPFASGTRTFMRVT